MEFQRAQYHKAADAGMLMAWDLREHAQTHQEGEVLVVYWVARCGRHRLAVVVLCRTCLEPARKAAEDVKRHSVSDAWGNCWLVEESMRADNVTP